MAPFKSRCAYLVYTGDTTGNHVLKTVKNALESHVLPEVFVEYAMKMAADDRDLVPWFWGFAGLGFRVFRV